MVGIFSRTRARFFAPKVPVVRVSKNGHSIEFMGYLVNRGNSLIEPWNQKGYEIHSDPTEITVNGKKEMGYAVDEAGVTITLKRNIKIHAADPDPIKALLAPTDPGAAWGPEITYSWEGIIGRAATLDDISDGLDLGKSMKNTIIGIIVGIPLGWLLTVGMK